MADLRLHRAQHVEPGWAPASPNTLGQGPQLGAVADDRAGAVRLDQADLGRRDAGVGVGPLERPALALGAARSGPGPAVGGAAARLDHRVDAVAVALGVGQALEDDAGHALAQGDAVGRGVEGRGTGPVGDSAWTLANNRKSLMPLCRSAPPHSTMSLAPVTSSLQAGRARPATRRRRRRP